MEIPELKDKLTRVLGNYALELELRQGCNTILTSDMAELYTRLYVIIIIIIIYKSTSFEPILWIIHSFVG